MKIALVSTHATGEGGVPHYVASLARVLAEGHEVTVYSSRFESLDGTGVRHRKMRASGSSGMIFDLSFLIVSTLMIWGHRLKRGDDFDIIHSHVGSPFFAGAHPCSVSGSSGALMTVALPAGPACSPRHL